MLNLLMAGNVEETSKSKLVLFEKKEKFILNFMQTNIIINLKRLLCLTPCLTNVYWQKHLQTLIQCEKKDLKGEYTLKIWSNYLPTTNY